MKLEIGRWYWVKGSGNNALQAKLLGLPNKDGLDVVMRYQRRRRSSDDHTIRVSPGDVICEVCRADIPDERTWWQRTFGRPNVLLCVGPEPESQERRAIAGRTVYSD